MQADPLTGAPVEVLWVKGSGGDLGSMKPDGFSMLYMDKLRALKALYRGPAQEDEMVAYLPHCTFDLNTRAASIDTPLHSSLPYRHVDHMHPDAVIAIAAMANSKAITEAVFEDMVGGMPWLWPGYELGQQLAAYELEALAALGTSCPDHFLRTKIRPLIIPESVHARSGVALCGAHGELLGRLPRRLRRLLRALRAPDQSAAARPQSRGAAAAPPDLVAHLERIARARQSVDGGPVGLPRHRPARRFSPRTPAAAASRSSCRGHPDGSRPVPSSRPRPARASPRGDA